MSPARCDGFTAGAAVTDPRAEALAAAIAALRAQQARLGPEAVAIAVAVLERARQEGPPPVVPATALSERPADAAAAPRLQPASVLFLDIVGSTRFADTLAPEAISAVMDGALAAFTDTVERTGGRVMQYAGDSLLAVFGADGAADTAADRAVLAGLALLATARLQAARVRQRHPQAAFAVRVGVATGPVMLGGGVDEGATVRGRAVHVAARMEQTAPVGALRVCDETWRQVGSRFLGDPQPPIAVKGVEAPIASVLVQAARDEAGVDPGAAAAMPLVGRDALLADLTELLDQAAAQGGLAACTLMGEAGVGKSRLLDRLAAEAGRRGLPVLHTRSLPGREGEAYGLLRRSLSAALALPASASAADLAAALTASMGASMGVSMGAGGPSLPDGPRDDEPPEVAADWLLRLLQPPAASPSGGVDDPEALRERAFQAATRWWRAWVRRGRTGADVPYGVWLLDDLQWADQGSLDFLRHLQRRAPDLPLLICSAARGDPADAPTPEADAEAGPPTRALAVPPLDRSGALALAGTLLAGLQPAAPGLAALLAETGGGNPQFMGALAAHWRAGGLPQSGGADDRDAPDAKSPAGLPGSLAAALHARLLRLSPTQQAALAEASVVGPVFWDAALDPAAAAALPSLEAAGLVQRQPGSTLDGAVEYRFGWHGLEEAAYARLLAPQRRAGHARVARWLAARADGGLADLRATHWARAGEPARAAADWLAVAESAAARWANPTARQAYAQVLALCPAGDTGTRCRALQGQLIVLRRLGAHDAAAETLQAMEALAATAAPLDPVNRAEIGISRIEFDNDRGEAAAALAAAEQLLAAAAPGAPGLRARLLMQAAVALRHLGRFVEASARSAEALPLAVASGDRRTEAALRNDLGIAAMAQGDSEAAERHLAAALVVHRQVGHQGNEAATLANLAYIAGMAGDLDTARHQMAQAADLSARLGHPDSEGLARVNLSVLHGQSGDRAAALSEAERAVALLQNVGDAWALAAAWRALGHAQLALDLTATAENSFASARDMADAQGLGYLALEALAGLVLLALARGDVATAHQQALTLLARQDAGASLDGADEPLRVPLACYLALQAAGDGRADEVLQGAHAALMAGAARLPPARRQRFLLAIPHHRALTEAWAARGQTGDGP